MAIFELKNDSIIPASPTTFGFEGIKERSDLQHVLRSHIGAVSSDTLLIAEEFGQWDDSKRRIDLLGLDKQANLVVIELKRTEDGGHMELQAIRYAAMVSTMTFEQVLDAREAFQRKNQIEGDARATILDFLEWEEPDEDQFAQDVRIVLVSSDFAKELTTAVMWLNTHDLDIRCVRLKPYSHEGHILLDVQQVIPLPEAAEYQVQIKEKTQKERKAKQSHPDFTRYDISIRGQRHCNMWKRRAMLLVARTLVEEDIAPEKIADLVEERQGNMWWRVEGDFVGTVFVEQAASQAKAEGRTFSPKRWFCEDDDLIRWDGSTCAFTKQWGSDWSGAIDRIAEAYPELHISYAPTNELSSQITPDGG